jgi:hypothetical protein
MMKENFYYYSQKRILLWIVKEEIPGLLEMLSIEFARELDKINPNVELLNVVVTLDQGVLGTIN